MIITAINQIASMAISRLTAAVVVMRYAAPAILMQNATITVPVSVVEIPLFQQIQPAVGIPMFFTAAVVFRINHMSRAVPGQAATGLLLAAVAVKGINAATGNASPRTKLVAKVL